MPIETKTQRSQETSNAGNQAPTVLETTLVAWDLDLPKILWENDVKFAAPTLNNKSKIPRGVVPRMLSASLPGSDYQKPT